MANAGRLLPVTLAHRLGLGELADHHVDLGDALGRGTPPRNGWWPPRQCPPRLGSPGTARPADPPVPLRSDPSDSRSSDLPSSCPLQHHSVGASPEGVTDCSHSPQRDRPDRGVANDAAVGLPDHALRRATSASVLSVLVRTTRLVGSLHVGPTPRQLVSSVRPGPGHDVALYFF